MKIIIIGHQGNLGQKLMQTFKDYEPLGFDKEDFDITNENTVKAKINKSKPDFVINASAYNAVDACEESRGEYELAKQINGYGPGYLAKACHKNNAVLVHYSTDYVFKGDKKSGYRESDKPDPIQNYGQSKLLGEKEVQKYGDKFYIIRTSKLFGRPGLSDQSKKSFIDIMLELSKVKDTLEVVNEEFSCFTYTPDLAKQTYNLLFGSNNNQYGIYHFVNEGPCTWFECAVKLFNIINKNIEIKPISGEKFKRPAKRPKYSRLLNTKTEKMRSLDQALRSYLKEIKEIYSGSDST
ncbi:MAG: dTDP-4-dehydrorhamnose reductase [Candidatus Moranbacteria bacterium]|nr:dTDP-4-dehydrorhamnose reductase [Candidatus Moranbacteria bacterium]